MYIRKYARMKVLSLIKDTDECKFYRYNEKIDKLYCVN